MILKKPDSLTLSNNLSSITPVLTDCECKLCDYQMQGLLAEKHPVINWMIIDQYLPHRHETRQHVTIVFRATQYPNTAQVN